VELADLARAGGGCLGFLMPGLEDLARATFIKYYRVSRETVH
jgi:hypothetical protein